MSNFKTKSRKKIANSNQQITLDALHEQKLTYFQYLVILLFCNAFLIQRAESETRYSFIVSADPQYVAEKSPQPKKLDPFSDQANSRFVNLMQSFTGTEIPDSYGGGAVDDKILGILVAGDLIDSADKNVVIIPLCSALNGPVINLTMD